MEKIIKLESDLGKHLVHAGQESLLADLRGRFLHTVKVLIQDKMRLQDEIAKATARISLLDRRLAAIENGEVSFDMLKGQVIFAQELRD